MLKNNDIRQADYYEESFNDDFKEETKKRNTRSSSWSSIADKLIEKIDTHLYLSSASNDKVEKNKFLILCTNYIVCRYKKQIGFNPSYSIDPETFHFESNTIWDYCPDSDKILDIIIDACQHYKPETGKFSHYFNRLVSKNLGSVRSGNSIDDHSHGTIPESEKRAARKFCAAANRFCKENNISQDEIPQKSEEIISMIYENTDLGIDKIRSMFDIIYKTKFVSGDAPQSDDDATSVMSNQEDPTQDIEQFIEQKSNIHEYGKIIDKVIKATQARTAPTIKAYVTNRLYKECPDLIDQLVEFDFFDRDFAKEIEAKLEEKNSVFTNQEIAERFSVSAANISKITGTFDKRMEEELKKAGFL